MPTLFKILRDKFSSKAAAAAAQPLEAQIYNPVGVKISSLVIIDHLDYLEKRFSVRAITEGQQQLVGQVQKTVDYDLVCEEVVVKALTPRLRLSPSGSSPFYRLLVLNLFDTFGYDEEFEKNVLKNSDNEFMAPNETTIFQRCGGVSEPYTKKLKRLADVNHDGQITANEIQRSEIEYWDYSGKLLVDEVATVQFVFVEKDLRTGVFEIWRGEEIAPDKIDVVV